MATEEESGTDPKKNDAETDESLATTEEETEASSSGDAPPAKRSGKSKKKARERERIAAEAARRPSITPSRALGFAIVALAAGGAAGWFGHIAQAKAKLRADTAPAASGSATASGPCANWEKQICAGSGATSAACEQAKSATGLLTPATCEVALEAVPATLAKVKAERVPCTNLVAKLCKDLPPGSPACTMVTERTPAFPPEKCKELLANYAAVLQEVQMIDQQGGLPQQGMPPGGPPGMPHGMPPGAHPPH